MHRRENFAVMEQIYDAIRGVECNDCLFLIPVHPNPKAGASARRACDLDQRFICSENLNYQQTHWMLNHSIVVLTDSGGLQEEATFYGVPVLVLRENTERPEAVDAGISVMVGGRLGKLPKLFAQLVDKTSSLHEAMSRKLHPFGDGFTSERILDVVEKWDWDGPPELAMAIINESALPLRPLANVGMERALPRPQLSSNEAPKSQEPRERPTVHLCKSDQDPIVWACDKPDTIAVVITVFRRANLELQLEDAVHQSMKPDVIVVYQNTISVD